MKITKVFRTLVAVLVLVLCFALPIYPLSEPGKYSGYSVPIYSEVVRISHYINIRGINLAIDVYRPAINGKPVSEPWPAILTNTRYNRGTSLSPTGTNLVKHGYVVSIMDPRGAGASYGKRDGDYSPDENLDGKAVIEWLAAQPWCNGRVAMMGTSYLGITQLMIAGTQPPHLVAIFPVAANMDTYWRIIPNGVWIPQDYLDIFEKPLDLTRPLQPVDEDPAPNYPLGNAAREEHKFNLYNGMIFYPDMFRDSWSDLTQNRPNIDTSAFPYSSNIKASGVAIYQVTGWYDSAPKGQLAGFKLWGDKIVIGPWTHGQTGSAGGMLDLVVEHLRWFDYILKGIDNSILDEPPVYYYTINAPAGKEWRFAPDWPLSYQKLTNYYFDAGPSGTVTSVNDGSLTTIAPSSSTAKDNYSVDYSVKLFGGKYDRMNRVWDGDMTENPDKKGLTYTTATLDSDLEITGHPVTNLWVTSTAPDGYFIAYLEEVYSDGVSHYVTDGVLRASHRAIDPNEPPWSDLGIPYHRSFAADYAVLPSYPVELAFDLSPISYVFRKGNRIRVTVTCSNQTYYPFPPSLTFAPPPIVTIYRDATHPSYITLPVIPPKATVFDGTAKVRIAKTTYEGPAKLYTFPTAVYLHYEDKWLLWDVSKTWETGGIEQFRGEGELGKLQVWVINNERISFDVLAIGNGVHFKGNAD